MQRLEEEKARARAGLEFAREYARIAEEKLELARSANQRAETRAAMAEDHLLLHPQPPQEIVEEVRDAREAVKRAKDEYAKSASDYRATLKAYERACEMFAEVYGEEL